MYSGTASDSGGEGVCGRGCGKDPDNGNAGEFKENAENKKREQHGGTETFFTQQPNKGIKNKRKEAHCGGGLYNSNGNRKCRCGNIAQSQIGNKTVYTCSCDEGKQEKNKATSGFFDKGNQNRENKSKEEKQNGGGDKESCCTAESTVNKQPRRKAGAEKQKQQSKRHNGAAFPGKKQRRNKSSQSGGNKRNGDPVRQPEEKKKRAGCGNADTDFTDKYCGNRIEHIGGRTVNGKIIEQRQKKSGKAGRKSRQKGCCIQTAKGIRAEHRGRNGTVDPFQCSFFWSAGKRSGNKQPNQG